jgi:hypothetical protein
MRVRIFGAAGVRAGDGVAGQDGRSALPVGARGHAADGGCGHAADALRGLGPGGAVLNLAAARIWLCVEPTDMRKSFDTLAARVREHLRDDPLSGAWFVFRGKRGDRLKILYWDGDGFALWQKRLAKGAFELTSLSRCPIFCPHSSRFNLLSICAVPNTIDFDFASFELCRFRFAGRPW